MFAAHGCHPSLWKGNFRRKTVDKHQENKSLARRSTFSASCLQIPRRRWRRRRQQNKRVLTTYMFLYFYMFVIDCWVNMDPNVSFTMCVSVPSQHYYERLGTGSTGFFLTCIVLNGGYCSHLLYLRSQALKSNIQRDLPRVCSEMSSSVVMKLTHRLLIATYNQVAVARDIVMRK